MRIANFSLLEDMVSSIYHSLAVTDLASFNCDELIAMISEKFDISTYYFDEASEANNLGGKYRIFLNENQSPQKIWQDFGHELGHILIHEGHQQSMVESFRIYQEWQAEKFAYHFCIPTFMLNELAMPKHKCEAIGLISRLFNVEPHFADTRLDKWLRSREAILLNT
ncbi:ImmA/IrrE family metallo-endopeptidase [Sporosarcina luteola]|uniref:ImmA/IrrE family metallo-endopeptidase n=1 Tax=Sporosarcina luteola TaxID=582850 RepID=UPI00203D41BA|nr:ImmA/IrrE family metallo-endopeptidase [Sporosarcina luteola]MCM3711005.1 ImmA/IrrE family metallo-endopeptidase [Sporosarcina luteola]